MPGLNQSGEVVTIPPYILPQLHRRAPGSVVVNWPVVFQCGGVGFVTVQRRCRLTHLFPAGATPRRPAEPLPAQSPPPPARRDPIGAATDGAAGTEWILRRCRSGVLVRTPSKMHATPARVRTQTVLPAREERCIRGVSEDYSLSLGSGWTGWRSGEAALLSATDESNTQAPQVNSLQQVITRHSSFLSSAPHTRSPHTRSAAEAGGAGDGTVVGEGAGCVGEGAGWRRAKLCLLLAGRSSHGSQRHSAGARRPLRCRRHRPSPQVRPLPRSPHPRIALCPCL